MSDLRLLASVYSEVRLADCLAGLAMTLLEEEAPALALLPVCDECLREGGLDCLTPVFCYAAGRALRGRAVGAARGDAAGVAGTRRAGGGRVGAARWL